MTVVYVWLSVLTVIFIGAQWPIWKLWQFRVEWIRYRKARQSLLDNLTDPGAVEFTELEETGAIITEASNRTTAVRPDAGPPARVHRPKAMRAKLPTRWNPPADYNTRLRGR